MSDSTTFHKLVTITYGTEAQKLKVRANSSSEDIQNAIRARFRLGNLPFALVDSEGFDVIVDHTLTTGAYQLAPLPNEGERGLYEAKTISTTSPRKVKAVIVTAVNQASIETILLDPPSAGEILVQMKATGICHSDLSIINGTLPYPLPAILGHEGAGIVTEIGPNVDNVKVGDHVVMSFVPTCNTCFHCVRNEQYLCEYGRTLMKTYRAHTLDGKNLTKLASLGCMAEYAVVPNKSVVVIDKKIPLEKAALVGCGVMTGVGAATKTAKVTPGSTAIIFGAGGVGLSVIQGAKLAGALKIIGIDVLPNKLDAAREFGATHTIDSSKQNTVEEVKKLTGERGGDFVFDVTGIHTVTEQALQVTRRGGTLCIVGLGKEKVSFSTLQVVLGSQKILGCLFGSANFRIDMPALLDLYLAGKLNLDKLTSKTYSIDNSLEGFDDLVKGKNLRGVILYP